MKKLILTLICAAGLTASAWAQKTVVSNESPQGKVFDVVEQMPQFPGGPAALMDYLMDNIRYPKEAEDAKQEGRVIASFTVETDGSISSPKIFKGVSPSIDDEAIRVISNMPKWIPGMQNGEPVRVKYTVPLSFRLKGDKDEKKK